MSDASPITLAAQDAMLIENGWDIAAGCGKAVYEPGWTKRKPLTLKQITKIRADNPDWTNTAIRTGFVGAVDNDLENDADAKALEELTIKILGDTPFRRVGSKASILVYRNLTPIKKITLRGADSNLFEILGVGQEFMAFGKHPKGTDYKWDDELGVTPLLMRPEDLPLTTPDKLKELAHAAAKELTKRGYGEIECRLSQPGDEIHRRKPNGKPISPAIIEKMLSCIPPDCCRNDWLKVCAGLVGAPIDDPKWNGLDAFIRWASGGLHKMTPHNFKGEDDCIDQWERDVATFNRL